MFKAKEIKANSKSNAQNTTLGVTRKCKFKELLRPFAVRRNLITVRCSRECKNCGCEHEHPVAPRLDVPSDRNVTFRCHENLARARKPCVRGAEDGSQLYTKHAT